MRASLGKIGRGWRIAAWLSAGLLVAMAIAFLWLRSESGGRFLARILAGEIETATGLRAEIEDLIWRAPLEFRIGRLVLRERGETLLEASDFAGALAVAPLLVGDLRFTRLTAAAIALRRLPQATAEEAAAAPPSLPRLPFSVERFAIERLAVSETVLGRSVTLSSRGSIRGGARPYVDIAVARIDGGEGTAVLQAALGREVSVTLRVEDSEGLFSQLFALPGEPQPLSAAAGIDGTMQSWRGGLSARLGGDTVSASLEGGGPRLDRQAVALRAEIAAPSLVPGVLAERIGIRFALAANATLAEDGLRIGDATLSPAALPGLTLRGDAQIETAPFAVTASAQMRSDDLAALGLPLAGRLEAMIGEWRWQEGTALPPFDVRIALTEMSGLPVPAASLLGANAILTARVMPETDGFALPSITLDGANIALTGEGRYSEVGGADFEVTTTQFDTRAFVSAFGVPAAGDARLRLRLEGTREALGATLTAEAPTLRIAERRITTFDFTARMENLTAAPSAEAQLRFALDDLPFEARLSVRRADEKWRLTAVDINAPDARLTGAAVLAEKGFLDGEFDLRVGSLAPLAQAFSLDAAGEANATVTLAGRDDRQALRMVLDARSLRVASQAAFDRVAGSLRIDDLYALDGGDFALRLESGHIRDEAMKSIVLEGTLENARLDFTMRADSLLDDDFDFELAGEARMRALRRVAVDRVRGRLAGQPVSLSAPIVWEERGRGWTFSAPQFTLGGGSGRIALGFDGAGLSGDAMLERVAWPLAWVDPLLPRNAILSLALTLDGPIENPAADLDATVALRDDGGWDATAKVEGRLRNRTLELDARMQAPETTLSLGGTVQLAEGLSAASLSAEESAIALQVEGRGDLTGLNDFLPLGEDRVAGPFRIDAALGGSLASPRIEGRLTLDGGRYENVLTGAVFADLRATVQLARDRLLIERLTATDGNGGDFVGQGSAAWGTEPRFDVQATFRRFRLVRRDDLTATVSGDVRLEPGIELPMLRGDLAIDAAAIALGDAAFASIPSIDVVEIPQGRSAAPPTPAAARAFSISLNIDVRTRGPLFVRGRGLDSQWGGRVRVTGTSAAPQLTGRLEVERGSYALLGRRLTLDSGALTMTGGGPREARLSVTSRTQSNGTTLEISLAGPIVDPRISLSSSPPLPSEEVLSRLLFGRARTSLGALEAIQLADAARSLAGIGGSTGLVERLRDVFGLATLDVGTDEEGNAEVRAGTYVGRGVFVGVERNTGSGESEAKVEIDVTRNLSLESTVGTGDRRQVILNWSRDY